VGKSTLFNRLSGEERSVVHDLPGTTRDAIDTLIETESGTVRLIDTAGMRRRARSGEGPEYYSLVRALRALDRADVALLVLDASEGVTHQDQRLAERIDASGSPVVILLNKWDLLDTEGRLEVSDAVADRLAFLGYAPVLRVSAKTGLGVQRLLPAVQEAMNAYHRRVPTGRLNDGLRSAQSAHPAPGGARILYGVQGAVDPPTITLFATRRLPPTYLRYLERSLRERFELGPTPIELRVRVRQQR
jgi:GTP-binding protein